MAKVLKQTNTGRQKQRIDGVGQYDWEEESGGGGGSARVPMGTEYEFKVPGAPGTLDPAKLLSEIALDGLDTGLFTLAAGTTNNQEKRIQTATGGNSAETQVTGTFKAYNDLSFNSITFNTGNQGVILFWSASAAAWYIRQVYGPTADHPLIEDNS